MAIGLRLRRHSWACFSSDKSEIISTMFVKKEKIDMMKKNRNFEEKSKDQAIRRRRLSAFDVLETVINRKDSNGNTIRPKNTTKCQERFLAWIRGRRKPEKKFVSNVNAAGLLDHCGENFRCAAFSHAQCDLFCTW